MGSTQPRDPDGRWREDTSGRVPPAPAPPSRTPSTGSGTPADAYTGLEPALDAVRERTGSSPPAGPATPVFTADDFPDVGAEYRDSFAAHWKAHAHPETTDPSDPLENADVHTDPSQCRARMCTYIPSETAAEFFPHDPEYQRLWANQPEDIGRRYIQQHGHAHAASIAEARAEQARAQWSGDPEVKWF